MSDSTTHNNADPQLCKQCKGLCCQGHPGVWIDPGRFMQAFALPRPTMPEDWLTTLSQRGLTLRQIDGIAIPAPPFTEQGCTFLAEHGCRLPETERPCQCLQLTPSIDTLLDGEINCSLPPEGSTLTAIRRWRDFWQKTGQP